ncbi:MAG: osmotically inducible protein OsmC [Cytophagia bacterium]|nr:osmotically inducible protein OsmC [Cytophagia bacterium]|tara:strand:- start:9270 stop:9683 length:414 start_codon:yes stop_codon:yes gene_type:complete
MEVNVSMSYLNDEKFQVLNESGNKLTIDMYEKDKKENLSPMELLLSAVTTCAAVEIVSMIKKRRRDFRDLKAESSGIRAETHPMYYKKINIKYIIYSKDLQDSEAERFISLALTKYCSVGSSIRMDTEVVHSFEIIR